MAGRYSTFEGLCDRGLDAIITRRLDLRAGLIRVNHHHAYISAYDSQGLSSGPISRVWAGLIKLDSKG